MVAKKYQELIVWQLADELRQEVYGLTASGTIVRDFKSRSQLRDAAGAIAPNIAEGFRRGSSTDNARFVTYALTSLDETQDRLDDGIERRHWVEADLTAARRLVRRLTPALGNYLSYLLTEQARERSREVYLSRASRMRRT
jgi:four helix bundle protein